MHSAVRLLVRGRPTFQDRGWDWAIEVPRPAYLQRACTEVRDRRHLVYVQLQDSLLISAGEMENIIGVSPLGTFYNFTAFFRGYIIDDLITTKTSLRFEHNNSFSKVSSWFRRPWWDRASSMAGPALIAEGKEFTTRAKMQGPNQWRKLRIKFVLCGVCLEQVSAPAFPMVSLRSCPLGRTRARCASARIFRGSSAPSNILNGWK